MFRGLLLYIIRHIKKPKPYYTIIKLSCRLWTLEKYKKTLAYLACGSCFRNFFRVLKFLSCFMSVLHMALGSLCQRNNSCIMRLRRPKVFELQSLPFALFLARTTRTRKKLFTSKVTVIFFKVFEYEPLIGTTEHILRKVKNWDEQTFGLIFPGKRCKWVSLCLTITMPCL